MIPYGKQIISEDDIEAVIAALKSPLITQGPVVEQFEEAVADYCSAKYGVAVNSGTAALHIACLALDIGPDDLVWTTPISFAATANCALYCQARVDFVDVEYGTGNISVQALEEKLLNASEIPKLLIVVHLAGMPCDMAKIHQLSQRYGFRVIEDACHALGARYGEYKIGSCQYSDITVFSFHPVKAITTGEGGMALTCDDTIAQKLRLYRSHGITRDETQMEGPSEGGWYYQQLQLGFNYRMPEINAALGLSQLKKLDEWIRIRNSYASFYQQELSHCPGVVLPQTFDDRLCAYHLFIIKVDPKLRLKIYNELREHDIGVNVHYIPIYHHPYYQKIGSYKPLKVTEEFYSQIITIPLCPALSLDDLKKVTQIIKQITK